MKHRIFFIAAILIGLFVGGAVSLFQEPYVEISLSFVVQNRRQAAESVYDYEGYYTLRTANETAKTLSSWVISPGGVSTIYRDAGIAGSFASLRDYEKAFKARRDETPFFEIRFRHKFIDAAEKLSVSMEKLLKEELAAFQGKGSSLSLGASAPVYAHHSVPLVRNLLYGALVAAAFAAFLMLFRQAMKPEE